MIIGVWPAQVLWLHRCPGDISHTARKKTHSTSHNSVLLFHLLSSCYHKSNFEHLDLVKVIAAQPRKVQSEQSWRQKKRTWRGVWFLWAGPDNISYCGSGAMKASAYMARDLAVREAAVLCFTVLTMCRVCQSNH